MRVSQVARKTREQNNKKIKIQILAMRQVAAPPHLEHTMSALGKRLQIQRKEMKREEK